MHVAQNDLKEFYSKKALYHTNLIVSSVLNSFYSLTNGGILPIYFPSYFDFRGRFYYMGGVCSPTASKEIRAFFSTPVLYKLPLNLFKYFVVKYYASRKLNQNEAVIFFDRNHLSLLLQRVLTEPDFFESIKASLNEPEQFLRCAYEYRRCLDKQGSNISDFIETNMYVSLDASASGAQILALLVGDTSL